MKINLTTIFLIVFAFGANYVSAASLQGQLLKSNGKPLPYTEIELVPVDSDKIVIDRGLNAVSATSGKFSFINVPDGKYTLSINFGDKPSDLSPYSEYFYPNTYQRSEALVFEITRTSKFTAITFRLPPPLAQRKIVGKVVFSDGAPAVGAMIAVRDVRFDESVLYGAMITDATGSFSVKGFEGRLYQFGAILFDRMPKSFEDQPDLLAAGESNIFTLDAKTPVIKFEIKTKGNLNRIKEKYLGLNVDDKPAVDNQICIVIAKNKVQMQKAL